MRDPLRRLQRFPWLSLAQVAVLTTLAIATIDFAIAIGYAKVLVLRQALLILNTPLLGLLISLGFSLAVGALAVFFLERWYRRIFIDAGTLWAFVFCLLVCFYIRSSLHLPEALFTFNEVQFMMTILGVFWKGRPYW